ncbi:DUF6350 family protein [Amycolatopsis acidiphila]|uniref:cell division protein PerM n=1 Tax=Amycolatopsis acidiphila TaxID=715473 RepID=UPI001643EE0A|nr:DUF6350 family protein [Amycolatopsis acidiphila]UIJ60788.1 DUF6350 family protein [Amycolatopsis acidiphila]GHG93903.1 hypothetical protein GCM10017788_71490 [Amycolatopsis acidiphila]
MQLLTPPSPAEEEVNDLRDTGELSGAARAKVVIAAAFGPLIAGYALVVALFALVTALASIARFSVLGVLRAAAPGLLAAYQVPVTIAGSNLGVLPLLATVGVGALVAGSAAHAAGRLRYREPGQAVNVVAPIAATHALAGITVALTVDTVRVSIEPLTAFLVPGFVAAVAATAGVARRCGIAAAARDYLDPVALRGLRAGALGMVGLFAVGALVFTVGLGASVHTAATLFSSNSPGFGSGVGMLLLSVGYLPNAIVATLSFVAGPGFSLGSVSLTPFAYQGGNVPGLPLLAGMPEHAARWWPVLMLLPAAVGVFVGWSLRHSDEDPRARLRTVGIAGALIGFGCVLLGMLAGGRLGAGSFNPVSVPVGLLSVAAFGWIVVPGGLVAWLAGPHRVPAPVVVEEPEPEDFDDSEELEEPAELEDVDEAEEPEEADESDEADEPEEAEEPEEDEGDDAAEESPPTSEEPEQPS